jgi:hypothetical protein
VLVIPPGSFARCRYELPSLRSAGDDNRVLIFRAHFHATTPKISKRTSCAWRTVCVYGFQREIALASEDRSMMGNLVVNRASHETYVTQDIGRTNWLSRLFRALFGRH